MLISLFITHGSKLNDHGGEKTVITATVKCIANTDTLALSS